MNQLFLAQTTHVVNTNDVATLKNNGRDLTVYLLNNGKCFVTALEYQEQGRDCPLYITANYNPSKNLVKT